MKEHPKAIFSRRLQPDSKVIDVGCWQYTYYNFCRDNGLPNFKHYGFDYQLPDIPPPENYKFFIADAAKGLPIKSNFFDAVIGSHVYEHVPDGLSLVNEIFRILRPGGLLYFESPSERSLWFPSMPFKFEKFHSTNFLDDPTHIGRPISPQGLYRLFRMFDGEIIEVDYIQSKMSRIRFPFQLALAMFRKDPAKLEASVWNAWGFSVYGIVRKKTSSTMRYAIR